MTKGNIDSLSDKDSTQLIVYQIGEMKGLVQGLAGKFDSYKADSDKRLAELEKFQAMQLAKSQTEKEPIDIQKIILAAFSLISTVVAIALGFNQTK